MAVAEATSMRPTEPYLIQQLALATYKAESPSPWEALEEARRVLLALHPAASSDPETLGLWGTLHKRDWEVTQARGALEEAIRAYQRGFDLTSDYYNGINLAFLLNERAVGAPLPDAVTDFVLAQRVRRRVVQDCTRRLASAALPEEDRYWLHATLVEAWFGLGEMDEAMRGLQTARELAPARWMIESTERQLARLGTLLARSPLDKLPHPAAW